MKKTLVTAASWLIAACLLAAAAPKPPAKNAAIERGRYLVEQVANCGECHTPRDAEGQLDDSRWLQGGPTWFTPIHATTTWAYSAPALAGLPSFTDQDMTVILEKGMQPDGRLIRPPMHVYHLTHEDAQAIIAYLRSLPPLQR
jgi:mono/diheme cytochrome c family protein